MFCVMLGIKLSINIYEYISFNELLVLNKHVAQQEIFYDDLFVSLEDDILTQPDYAEEVHEEDKHSHENLFKHNHFVDSEPEILSLKDALIKNEVSKKEDISVASRYNKSSENVSIDNLSNKLNIVKKQDHNIAPTYENYYTLPIIDALDVINHKANEKKEQFKKEIASLYQKREMLIKKAKKLTIQSSKDIKRLKNIFKILKVKMPKKLHNIKANLTQSKLLKQLNMGVSELSWRHPTLKNNLEILYKMQLFANFLPIHQPINKGRRTSSFGYRSDPFTKRKRMHAGIDYAARKGTPLIASGTGVIKYAGRKGGYGNVVEIYHGKGIFTRYAHMSKINVKKGQRVKKGQKIGAVGSTGRSTGAHLHYEIRVFNKPTNPSKFINTKKEILSIVNFYI